MAVQNRAAKLAKLIKIVKKHYKPVAPSAERSSLEHLLFACCLQDSTFEDADDTLARLQESYFDWNEIRVTTTVELAAVMKNLTHPDEAASRLKKTLHSMFETHYQFDLDYLKKENLGKAVQIVEQYRGITPFVVSYFSQNALGGHSIPLDRSMFELMFTVGIIDADEAADQSVPGLERAVSKNKGSEFFSSVHQLAVAFHKSPFNSDIRDIILQIDADAQERFPKRTRKKATPVAVAPKAQAAAVEKKTPVKVKTTAEKTVAKKAPVKKVAAKKVAAKPTKKTAAKKTKAATASKAKKKSSTKRLSKKKTALDV